MFRDKQKLQVKEEEGRKKRRKKKDFSILRNLIYGLHVELSPSLCTGEPWPNHPGTYVPEKKPERHRQYSPDSEGRKREAIRSVFLSYSQIDPSPPPPCNAGSSGGAGVRIVPTCRIVIVARTGGCVASRIHWSSVLENGLSIPLWSECCVTFDGL